MGQDLLLTLSILLSVPGRVKFGECCTGSASEAEEEVDALAVVVAEKHFETAAARSFSELVLISGLLLIENKGKTSEDDLSEVRRGWTSPCPS